MTTLFQLFAIGWLASFLGTLPFGPINLSVVSRTVKDSLRAGLWFAFAAALIEIAQSFIALHCSALINQYLDSSPWIKWVTAGLFILLGLVFMLRREKAQEEDSSNRKDNNFLAGIIISVINFQAIPFWIFILTYLDMSHHVRIDTSLSLGGIALFLIGVSTGKFAALSLFGLASQSVKNRVHQLKFWMNKIIGFILLLIGIFQFLSA
ncbi:MAG: LysE family transporter [Saprospiraceae bacterium]|nr:LysE family transporter [Saprospiraceae bacterium]